MISTEELDVLNNRFKIENSSGKILIRFDTFGMRTAKKIRSVLFDFETLEETFWVETWIFKEFRVDR